MRLSRLSALALLLLVRSAGAQVGHDPAHSPYWTLRYGQFLGATTGYFNGSGGQLGAAPHQGPTFGLRYDFLGAGTVTVGLAGSYGDLKRFIVNPHQPIATALTGPVKQHGTFVEGILQFNLTGGKTWHRIAPFVSTGVGLVIFSNTPADTSGFKLHSRATLTPGIGARLFLTERMFLRVEARSMFWSISYPASYSATPSSDPTKPAVLQSPGKEWTGTGWYSIGLSYAFHRPF